MKKRAISIAVASLSLLVLSPGLAFGDDTVTIDEAEVYIEAPGTRIAVDEDEGVVDIRAGDARIHAERSGRVDIEAPGVRIRVGKQ